MLKSPEKYEPNPEEIKKADEKEKLSEARSEGFELGKKEGEDGFGLSEPEKVKEWSRELGDKIGRLSDEYLEDEIRNYAGLRAERTHQLQEETSPIRKREHESHLQYLDARIDVIRKELDKRKKQTEK